MMIVNSDTSRMISQPLLNTSSFPFLASSSSSSLACFGQPAALLKTNEKDFARRYHAPFPLERLEGHLTQQVLSTEESNRIDTDWNLFLRVRDIWLFLVRYTVHQTSLTSSSIGLMHKQVRDERDDVLPPKICLRSDASHVRRYTSRHIALCYST